MNFPFDYTWIAVILVLLFFFNGSFVLDKDLRLGTNGADDRVKLINVECRKLETSLLVVNVVKARIHLKRLCRHLGADVTDNLPADTDPLPTRPVEGAQLNVRMCSDLPVHVLVVAHADVNLPVHLEDEAEWTHSRLLVLVHSGSEEVPALLDELDSLGNTAHLLLLNLLLLLLMLIK